MRIDVKKFVFVGAVAGQERFFESAQEAGVIEFIDPSKTSVREVPKELQEVAEAIKVLRGLPVVEQEERSDFAHAQPIVKGILALDARREKLHEERRILRQEMERVDVFGQFSWKELRQLEEQSGRTVQFYAAKMDADVPAKEFSEVLWLGYDHGLDYFVAFNKGCQSYEGMIEMKIDVPYGDLKARKEGVQRELDEIEAELKGHAKENQYLHETYRDRLNQYSLVKASKTVDLAANDRLFTVQGWVSKKHQEKAASLASEMDVHCEEIAIERNDPVPTFLENKGMSRIGEDLVHIYDTPSITDKDPSTWVLWSFALFFAIILGDGGYGILFLMVSLGLWFKFPKAKGLLRRVMKLSTILSVSCIIWGVLTNSFFGISFDLDSGVRQVSGLQWLVEQKADYHFAMQDAVYQDWADKYPAVASASNGYEMLERAVSEHGGKSIWKMLAKFSDSIMLELALVIGIIHLSLSLLRSFRDSWAGLGWILFMVGGYLYVPEYLACTSMAQFLGGVDKTLGAQLGMQMLQVGLGGAVLLAVIQHRMGGLGEIINVIQVFADVLSYLRLYALGLAGSMMSSTFNEIGSSAPFVAGFFIIFIGHVVNIVLSIMGGVIHGLRLNFLEWYHYCFEGGGKMFKPLEMLKVKERN